MRPARYVEIDCDLYSSTVQALTWLFEEGLIVEGTVLGYDDFYAGGADGEKKAHHELMRKYRVKLECSGQIAVLSSSRGSVRCHKIMPGIP